MELTLIPINYEKLEADGHQGVALELQRPCAALVQTPEGQWYWEDLAEGSPTLRIQIFKFNAQPHLIRASVLQHAWLMCVALGARLVRVRHLYVVMAEGDDTMMGLGVEFER